VPCHEALWAGQDLSENPCSVFLQKIIFNGEECTMPETFPTLPDNVPSSASPSRAASLVLPIVIAIFALLF